MTKEERQRRHIERLEQKAKREREMFESQRPKGELNALTTNLATDYLERPHLLPADERLAGLEVVLRLWSYPSFTPFQTWLVYRDRWNGNRCVLRKVTWDRLADIERIYGLTPEEIAAAVPSPSMTMQVVELDVEEFERRRGELGRIRIPVFTQNRLMGLDGESFGIAAGDHWQNSQLKWWCDGSSEWVEVVEWFGRMREWLEAVIDEHHTPRTRSVSEGPH